ncbi:MAG: NusG domain II-containing protein [Oscillospiraceae bacterium]|jgi:hypothetical protein|nr:NusG domain II-containing protein [Oscillospiraceae bacterium]
MKKGDAVVLAAVLLLAGALWLAKLLPAGPPQVVINGVPAAQSTTTNGVAVAVNGQRARVVSSPCRDKRCVRAGWLKAPGDTAVCLPQKVIVEIRVAKKDIQFDGTAY